MGEVKNLKIKVKNTSLLNGLLFIISPLLALPSIFISVYNRNKFCLVLLMIFASLITYQLIPSETKDLYQFYRFYKKIKNIGFEDFLFTLSAQKRLDFVVYFGIYFFAKLGLSGQLFFAICTFITLYLIYAVYEKLVRDIEISNRDYFLGIVSIFISIELMGLYSGIRNILAVSIAIYGFYTGLFEDKKIKGFLFIALGTFTHFGILLFVPVYIFGIFWKLRTKIVFIIYLISFFFLLFTKQYLHDIALSLPLPESFDAKIKGYLQGLDFIEKGIKGSVSAYLSYKIRISWIYFAHIYMFLTFNRKSSYRNIVILLMSMLNIFSVTPDIQLRLTYLVELMFIFLLFYEYKCSNNKFFLKLFFIFLIPSFFVNLIVLRDYFIESLFNKNFLTLIGILLKKVELIFAW
ncbi:EpsG family protein [uncultured Aquimarina sp.]|uniref:EpsG family protein n=1 Tax=uncultured Aquimarina sp. TaxID=575652 RepID=UPI00262A6230|nr:EpsG family protein [uncultured Aquimarina sp.]